MKQNFGKKTRDMLLVNGEIVMSTSEEPFLDQVIRRLKKYKSRSVLEAGFGLGISAGQIQKYLKPAIHHIVEIDRGIYKDLEEFSTEHASVTGILGDWMTFRPKRRYDLVFIDTYVLDEEEYCAPSDPEYEELNRKWSKRLRRLLSYRGVACIPQFDHDDPDLLEGLELVEFEKLKVPPYLLWDASKTTKGSYACWQYNKREA